MEIYSVIIKTRLFLSDNTTDMANYDDAMLDSPYQIWVLRSYATFFLGGGAKGHPLVNTWYNGERPIVPKFKSGDHFKQIRPESK